MPWQPWVIAGSRSSTLRRNLADEEGIAAVVERHRERFGRLDVLVNNAGVGIGAAAGDHQSKHIDLQLDVNTRAIVLFYRDCLEMLRVAGAEHRNALVVNMASLAGKSPQPWLSVYSATKAAVIAYTRAMNKELAGDGIKSVAFCPGFVDTDMSEFVKAADPRGGDAAHDGHHRGAAFPASRLAVLRRTGARLRASGRGDLTRVVPGRAQTDGRPRRDRSRRGRSRAYAETRSRTVLV